MGRVRFRSRDMARKKKFSPNYINKLCWSRNASNSAITRRAAFFRFLLNWGLLKVSVKCVVSEMAKHITSEWVVYMVCCPHRLFKLTICQSISWIWLLNNICLVVLQNRYYSQFLYHLLAPSYKLPKTTLCCFPKL